MNDEKLHGITYEITVHASREIIQEAAETGVGYEPEFIRACREWIATHPADETEMTRAELVAMPNGTILAATGGRRWVLVDGGWRAIKGVLGAGLWGFWTVWTITWGWRWWHK